DSQFKDVVSVVPGEADSYCAEFVRKEGGVVITGDSDLLVHELGPSSSVVFFKDIQMTDPLSKQISLKAFQYHPAAIARGMGLQSLIPFAFALKQDPSRSFHQCIRIAKQEAEDDPGYVAFSREYGSWRTQSDFDLYIAKLPNASEVYDILRRLDP